MANRLFVGNDNLIELLGFRKAVDSSYLNSATVTANLYEADKTTLVAGPLTMTYVAASNGDYRGNIADTVSLTAGKQYHLEVSADGGTDLQGKWVGPIIAEDRDIF